MWEKNLFNHIIKKKYILFSKEVTVVVGGWKLGRPLMIFVIMRSVVKIIVAVASLGIEHEAMVAETRGGPQPKLTQLSPSAQAGHARAQSCSYANTANRS